MAEPEVDDTALRLAAIAVEDVLIEWRDARRSILGPGNGFVINERDGTPSAIMRLRTMDGLRIGIRAYLSAMAVAPEDRAEAMRQAAERIAGEG